MPIPTLIIVSGLPCSGKTTIGQHIAAKFHLPFFHKDGFKEILFERLGYSDLYWSKQLSQASFDLLFYAAGELLSSGLSAILEGNFKAEVATPKFQALHAAHPFHAIQILCYAQRDVLIERYRQRERHPGHLDALLTEVDLENMLGAGCARPLGLPGHLIEIDTSSGIKPETLQALDHSISQDYRVQHVTT